ncbi:MAG: hypothetical protein BWY92_01946 [Firmicutes bacterium ADurb.BinA052]|nr:MAG: hypothetical protein BWY92_01946 [Firmicutes bacterium ADurb.BinA052]
MTKSAPARCSVETLRSSLERLKICISGLRLRRYLVR